MNNKWTDGRYPTEEGWYATKYCWDAEEGIFYGANYFDGKKWSMEYPVIEFSEKFENEFDAEKFAEAEDPEQQ